MNFVKLSLLVILCSFFSSAANAESKSQPPSKKHEQKKENKKDAKKKDTGASMDKNIQTAILAGGCFWGVEELFRNFEGVVSTEVGYTGGNIPNPTYEIVKKGTSGHAEAIRIGFDPAKLSYEDLLKFYFKIHDPTTRNQQGNDIGSQYRSAIFYLNDEQRKSAEKIKELVDTSKSWKKPVVTEITAATTFYSAEAFHQDYLQKNPGGYTCHYIRDIKF